MGVLTLSRELFVRCFVFSTSVELLQVSHCGISSTVHPPPACCFCGGSWIPVAGGRTHRSRSRRSLLALKRIRSVMPPDIPRPFVFPFVSRAARCRTLRRNSRGLRVSRTVTKPSRPYDIVATSHDAGIIEAIPDTVSIDALKKVCVGCFVCVWCWCRFGLRRAR